MLEQTPQSSEQSATNLDNGDRIDLHARSEHVKPYEKNAAALAAIATAETVNKNPEQLLEHEVIDLVGKYVIALRRARIEQYDFTPRTKDPLDFELTA